MKRQDAPPVDLGPGGVTTCQSRIGTTEQLQKDLAGAAASFRKFIGDDVKAWKGNIFAVFGHMVFFACAFINGDDGATAHVNAVQFDFTLQTLNNNCGPFDGAFISEHISSKVDASFGRTPTDTGFCGGNGVAFGTKGNQ